MIVRKYGTTDFITGLRSIAAIMVIAIHTAAFRELGWLGDTITGNGRYGVQIFFVISGFTIARTYRSAGSFIQYFGRRIARITPLYFFAILIAFLLVLNQIIAPDYWMTKYGSSPDHYNLAMHLTFLSGWDARIANSLLGLEWSIPVEVFWYLCLPPILKLATTRDTQIAAFGGLLLVAGMAKVIANAWLPSNAAQFLPLTHGAYFFLGAMAEKWRGDLMNWPETRRRFLTTISMALFILGLTTNTKLNDVMFALATAGLIAARGNSDGRRGLLDQRVLIFLGSISYSLYLLHPFVLKFMEAVPILDVEQGLPAFSVALVLTIGISVTTYLMIEKPSNMLGHRLFPAGSRRPAPSIDA